MIKIFTCPYCGSHSYQSYYRHGGGQVNYCVYKKGESELREGCGFSWTEIDNNKYIKEYDMSIEDFKLREECKLNTSNIMYPTAQLRWKNIENEEKCEIGIEVMDVITNKRVLQQLWLSKTTDYQEWRDVPEVFEKA